MGKMKEIAINIHNEGLDVDAIAKKDRADKVKLEMARYDAKMELFAEERKCDDCHKHKDECTCPQDDDEWVDDMEDDDDE
jgi:hypothetical protein